MAITRCATGIQELDQILRGGIPHGNVVLLAGGSGMGKTTL
ncbi:MAG TPA: ATPase domain-containing protein, partial [Candidatus Thermoplasmatota archaeon]|nr:ATPase domain-containing protein [Candidatus Thermoplasmatota archaeon]